MQIIPLVLSLWIWPYCSFQVGSVHFVEISSESNPNESFPLNEREDVDLSENSEESLKRNLRDTDYGKYHYDCVDSLVMQPDKVIHILTPHKGKKQYPGALDCFWEFIGDSNCFPIVSCTEVDLRESDDCSVDVLTISDGYLGREEFCGPNLGVAHYIKSNVKDSPYLWVTLKTTDSNEFDRLYKGIYCTVRCHISEQATKIVPLPEGMPPKEDSRVLCGRQYEEGKDRIVGGEVAQKLEFPWQVALVETIHLEHGRTGPFCGGSFINSQFVLTAAHCTIKWDYVEQAWVPYKPKDISVVLRAVHLDLNLIGDTDYDAKEGEAGAVDKGAGSDKEAQDSDMESMVMAITEIIVHQHYRRFVENDCDIALLKLKRHYVLSAKDVPTPICLPLINEPHRNYSPSGMATVTGWGKTHDLAGSTSRWLQKLEVPLVSQENCENWYADAKVEITHNMLCAGFEEGNKDACQGDSGGPLVSKDGDKYVQIGVVSFGKECAAAKKPGVYVKVANFLPWIHYHARGSTWPRFS